MHVSVVIPTRNRPTLLEHVLRAVLGNDYHDFAVTVVDQGKDGRAREVVRGLMESDTRLRYVHTDSVGLSRAYNVGLQETTGEVLAMTHDDCIAPGTWLSSIASSSTAEPDIDILAGQGLWPGNSRYISAWMSKPASHVPRRLSIRDGAFYFKHVRCGPPHALSLLVRRIAWLGVREALITLGVHRRDSMAAHLRSYLRGVRERLRFPIDRGRYVHLAVNEL